MCPWKSRLHLSCRSFPFSFSVYCSPKVASIGPQSSTLCHLSGPLQSASRAAYLELHLPDITTVILFTPRACTRQATFTLTNHRQTSSAVPQIRHCLAIRPPAIRPPSLRPAQLPSYCLRSSLAQRQLAFCLRTCLYFT